METLVDIIISGLVLCVLFGIIALYFLLAGWLTSLPYRRFSEERLFNAKILQKIPEEQTFSTETSINLISGSFVTPGDKTPRELLIDLEGKPTSCKCSKSVYDTVQVGDVTQVLAGVNPKTGEIRNHCYVP